MKVQIALIDMAGPSHVINSVIQVTTCGLIPLADILVLVDTWTKKIKVVGLLNAGELELLC